ncbi:hypothetical protein [Sorangium sp. So ce388]|uniref:hypothetical protein n=1 Tax=Sorangium sp. So ce388 TaxID=3133309 RepID=UPI003F5BCBEB
MGNGNGKLGINNVITRTLQASGHAGARVETVRAEVKRVMGGAGEVAFDDALEQLQRNGEVCEGTNGPGFFALSDLVRAYASSDEEMAEEPDTGAKPLDTLPVLAALQLLGDKGGSVEELQREIEAAGSGRRPLGVVFTLAQQLVEAGKAKREGAEEPEARFWLADPEDTETVIDRRARLLRTVFNGRDDGGFIESDLIDDALVNDAGLADQAARARADIAVLLDAKLLVAETEDEDVEEDDENDGSPAVFYTIPEEVARELVLLGSTALARRTVDTQAPVGGALLRLAPDATADAVTDTSGFERAAVEKAEIERKRADALQAQLNTIRGNLRRADLNPDWFAAPPPPAKPAEETVEYKERRVVDRAEKGAILDEILILERQVASKEAEFGILKSEHKAEIEALEQQIKNLKEDSESNARTVIIQARKERDWTAGVLRIVAIEDGRVLEEKPLPKGEQRTIPGTEAAPPAAAETSTGTPAPQEAIESFKESFAEKNGQAAPEAESAPGAAPASSSLIVDVAALPALERDVYEALRKANRPVTMAGLPDAVKAATGKTVGPAMKAKIEAAAGALVERCVVVREGESFRVLGAPAAAAPVKSSKERVWDALDGEPKSKGELRMRAGVTEEEVDEVLGALKKAGKIATIGKAKGTKYARAGAPGPEATV